MSDQTLTLTTTSPFDGGELNSYKCSTRQDVEDAVASAKEAFRQWSRTPIDERATYLIKLADELDRRSQDIATIITDEMGRVQFEALGEVTKSAAFLRYFASECREVTNRRPISVEGLAPAGKQAYSVYAPRGVVGIIKPWNAPLQQTIWALAPALISGCTCVIKPSEYTPQTGLELQRSLESVGFPKGVVQTMIGEGNVGEYLVEANVDVVAFTGSFEVGRKVAQKAAYEMKKSVLELSGKDYLLIDPDFGNLDLLANGIVYGAFSNCGHWCSSVETALIPEEIYDAVLMRVKEKTNNLKLGRNADVGPISNRHQFKVISSLVSDAIHNGAEVVCGGKPMDSSSEGLFFEPTILANVPDGSKILEANAFGPVIVLNKVRNFAEAVHVANSSAFGLGASIWTESEDFADNAVSELDVGMVWVNEPLQSIASCPWSVTKHSGIGVELGINGIKEFMYEKVVQYQFNNSENTRPWYFPYN